MPTRQVENTRDYLLRGQPP